MANADSTGQVFERDGVRYVAFATRFRQMGGAVTWDNASKLAHAEFNGRRVSIGMSNEQIAVDGSLMNLTGKPFVEDDILYVAAEIFAILGHPI